MIRLYISINDYSAFLYHHRNLMFYKRHLVPLFPFISSSFYQYHFSHTSRYYTLKMDPATNTASFATTNMMIFTGNMTVVQSVLPIRQSQAYEEDKAKLAEEKGQGTELRAEFRRFLVVKPGSYEKELRAYEKKARDQEKIAIGTGELILFPDSQEILHKEQQQKMELWMKATEDWREWIGRGRRGLRFLRAFIMCHERINKLRIKLQRESGEEKERIENHWRLCIGVSRRARNIDRNLLESERRLMECEENFRKWELKKWLEWEEESLESHNKVEWEEERRAIKREREATEEERRAVEKEREAIKREREATEKGREAMEQDREAMGQEREAMEQERIRMASKRESKKSIWKRLLKKDGTFGLELADRHIISSYKNF